MCELTGDSSDDASDEKTVGRADVIVTTPEKWDSFSRFRRDAQGVMGRVGLLMVDEIHTLGDLGRGPCLEAVIARMQTISRGDSLVASMPIARLRVLAASATVANVHEVAEWLGPTTAVMQFDESFRPVPLTWRVLAYPMGKVFTFDKALIGRLFQVVREYAASRPALVFCNSRKTCQQAAAAVAQLAASSGAFLSSDAHRSHLAQAAQRLADKPLAAMVRSGVAYHDASLDAADRRALEGLFASGALLVLCCTSGLAVGINLPARLVVVLNTAKYSSAASGYEEYSRIEVLQMAGRAGRPQFDDRGVCVIMTREEMRGRYEAVLGGAEVIESHMHEHLITHLNAEIAAAGSWMADVPACLRWLKSTFLCVRMRRAPLRFKLGASVTDDALDAHLKRLLLGSLRRLADAGMIEFADDAMGVVALPLGQIMARFCVDFDTCVSFKAVDDKSGLQAVVGLLAAASEFREPLYLRHAEKRALFAINASPSVRYPLMDGKKPSKVKTAAMKASLLLQLRARGPPARRIPLGGLHAPPVGRAHPQRPCRVPRPRGGAPAGAPRGGRPPALAPQRPRLA